MAYLLLNKRLVKPENVLGNCNDTRFLPVYKNCKMQEKKKKAIQDVLPKKKKLITIIKDINYNLKKQLSC